MKKLMIFVGLAIFLSSCASRLETYNRENKPTMGIPFLTPVLVKVTEQTTYQATKQEFERVCTAETDVKLQVLPLGEQGYINFDPAQFGKGEFKVEFKDDGTLGAVYLNSEATAAAGNVVSLLEALLPYIAALKPAPEPEAKKDSARELKQQSCIKTGTTVIKVERVKIE